MKLDRKRLGTDEVAVNVSPASLRDAGFTEWLQGALKVHAGSSAPDNFRIHRVRGGAERGPRQGIRGVSPGVRPQDGAGPLRAELRQFGYLQSLRPEYVKIDRAYTGELKDEDSDSRFFISSICSVAHSIDVVVSRKASRPRARCRY